MGSPGPAVSLLSPITNAPSNQYGKTWRPFASQEARYDGHSYCGGDIRRGDRGLEHQQDLHTLLPADQAQARGLQVQVDEEFDEVTPDKREVRSIVTVEGDGFKHVSKAKKEGVTGHTVVTEFKGHECTRYMTIEKVPDCVGVMKFRRMVDGKVLEPTAVDSLEEFANADQIAKMVITD